MEDQQIYREYVQFNIIPYEGQNQFAKKKEIKLKKRMQRFWVDYFLNDAEEIRKRMPTNSYDSMCLKRKKNESQDAGSQPLMIEEFKAKTEEQKTRLAVLKEANKEFKEWILSRDLKYFLDFDKRKESSQKFITEEDTKNDFVTPLSIICKVNLPKILWKMKLHIRNHITERHNWEYLL